METNPVNNPYPTNAQLAAEAEADKMLAEQAADTAAFASILRTAAAAIKKLHFPLGSPAKHFDLDDIFSTLRDFLIPPDDAALNDRADDIARAQFGLS